MGGVKCSNEALAAVTGAVDSDVVCREFPVLFELNEDTRVAVGGASVLD